MCWHKVINELIRLREEIYLTQGFAKVPSEIPESIES